MSRDTTDGSEARIVHVTTVHQPFDPRIFYRQLRSVREAGFEAHLIAPHRTNETADGVTIHALANGDRRLDRLRLQREAYRVARALDAALYQIHDPELLPLAYLLKKRTGTPVVYDMHENYRAKGPIAGRGVRAMERWGLSWLDHVLLAEESYGRIVADAAVKGTYIPNYFASVDAMTADRRGTPRMSERPRLLYTGTISETRGLSTMLDLAKTIRDRDRPEIIEFAGICRYEEQRSGAERRIEAEELNGVLQRRGWDQYLRPVELWRRYPDADVGLALFESHRNYRDSIPTKFYECLQFGVPLVCSDFPLWREFVDRHDCGVVVSPGDPEAVLAVLDEWHTHPNRYREIAENARTAAQEYRWGPVGERLVGIYRELLADRDGDGREESPSTTE